MIGGPAAQASVEEPLSPETIVKKNFVGKATVEFLVGEVYQHPTSWAASSDRNWAAVPLRIVPKSLATAGRVSVLVSAEVCERLQRLGIENLAEHFRGKVLRVSGSVERLPVNGGGDYSIQVNSLDQLEAIGKP
jgi:hypothetical protein